MKKQPKPHTSSHTSWEPVEKWYKDLVGKEGHYYHREVIIPNLLKIMDLTKFQGPSILDLACGQGILARHLKKEIPYVGLDISTSLISEAKKMNKNKGHHFQVMDVGGPLQLDSLQFSHVSIVLALQNIENMAQVFKNAFQHLVKGGRFFIVLNHPCFRIPRQSSWQVDKEKKMQYRRIDRYFTEMKIPILAEPRKGESSKSTVSFHHPLSTYSKELKNAGFNIELIEEWCSNKVSEGAMARMENRAREEFPLFMAIVATKA